jgi:hypothetical protein
MVESYRPHRWKLPFCIAIDCYIVCRHNQPYIAAHCYVGRHICAWGSTYEKVAPHAPHDNNKKKTPPCKAGRGSKAFEGFTQA